MSRTTPEGIVKKEIKKILDRYAPDVYYDMPVPSGYGKPTLDFDGVACGRAFSIEAKAPGKKPSDRQTGTASSKRRAGAVVFVIDGKNAGLELLDRWLNLVVATNILQE